MLKEKFFELIKEYHLFSPGDLVLVAVSGGADSTALLNLLHNYRAELGITPQVAHLNHLLRKTEAPQDVRYVEDLAQRLKIPVHVEAIDVAEYAQANKLGIEAAARQVRYEYFERVAKKIGAQKIAVGHTADDNVETFLMRLLRGSGMRGLSGIPPKRGKIVRPLLKIWRREIEDYVGSLKLVPRRDHTNYESKYMRNSVRLKLIPQLKLYNLNIKEIILQTILLLTSEHLYLEEEADKALAKVRQGEREGEITIDLNRMRNIADPIQALVLRAALKEVKGDLTEISFTHIQQLLGRFSATEHWEQHLPAEIRVAGDRNKLVISKSENKIISQRPFRYSFNVPGEVALPEVNGTLRATLIARMERGEDPKVAFIDYAVFGKETVVRSKLPGDRFSPLGVKGSKKLQDFFIDSKIPLEEREKIPIVESDGKIIWVAGLRLDEQAKVTPKTKKIVKLELL